jgi:hypothetical protein
MSTPAFFAVMAAVAAFSGLVLLVVHRRSGAVTASPPDPRLLGETLH